MSMRTDELTRSLKIILTQESRRRPTPVVHVPLDDLDLYRMGRLSSKQEASIQDHLAVCDYCSDLLLSLEEFGASLEPGSRVSDSEVDQAYRNLVEAELLSRIHQEPPPALKRRYSVLCKRRDAGSLSPEEQEELIRLVDQFEHLQAARVEAIADLVGIRGIPLEDLLKELSLKPLLDDKPGR